jgi:hypothetical protein
MDRRFCERVERAIRNSDERREAAAAAATPRARQE